MNNLFEKMLWNSRILLIVGVVCCMLTAICLVILGSAEVFHLATDLAYYLTNTSTTITRDSLVLLVVEILDTFLLSAILFIFSFGLYELFISPIEHAKRSQSQAFTISSIDDLKTKLGKVIIMILVVKVFAYIVEIKPKNMTELLYLSLVVLLVSVSLWLGYKKKI